MKYTKEQLEIAAKESFTIVGMIRALNGNVGSGGVWSHIRNKIKEFNIDISHFLGCKINKNRTPKNKQTAKDILVKTDEGIRLKASLLRRALDEINVSYECDSCKINSWNSKKLTLQIDHIDGNYLNNTKENLRYLCPNCHSQTSNWGFKSKK